MLPLYNYCTVDGSHFIDNSRLHSSFDGCMLHSGNGCMVWSTGKLYDDCVISIGQLCKQLSRSPIVADCFCVAMTKISSVIIATRIGTLSSFRIGILGRYSLETKLQVYFVHTPFCRGTNQIANLQHNWD